VGILILRPARTVRQKSTRSQKHRDKGRGTRAPELLNHLEHDTVIVDPPRIHCVPVVRCIERDAGVRIFAKPTMP
jgi:hypothetical protein